MNTKQAKKIIDKLKLSSDHDDYHRALFAKGYLEAVEDAKILADTLRAVIQNDDGEPYREFCRQALKEWEAEK